ncbi:MAG: serine hydrolase domain-containing protein [Flavitalea sp.]
MKFNKRSVITIAFCFLINSQITTAQTGLVSSSSIQVKTQTEIVSENSELPYSTPEAEGVSSAGILKFLDAVEKGKNEIHSFVIVRHGKIISNGWWSPYSKDLRHVMFSVSKSFTSTGIGLAINEKKLKLTDKVISFFPQSLPDTLSAYMKEMTVEHLLQMATGMKDDPLFTARNSKDWPKAFLAAPVDFKPGSVFKYNNMATFMLSAILQKATGEKLFDYIKPRLLEPLGITNVTWDETPEGYTFGAIGMRIQSEDMAKFGQMLLQKGKWNGKQIVPESWVKQATSFKINSSDPGNKTPKELNDWEQGYCYQFWRSRNNAYRADGLGGQFIIVLPEKDAVVVLTANSTNTQEEINLVWDHILPAMQEKALPEDKNALSNLKQRLSSLTVSKTSQSNFDRSSMWSKISGKKIELSKNESSINGLTISLKENEAQLQIDKDSEKLNLPAGKNQWKFTETNVSTLAPLPNAMFATPVNNQASPIKVASSYSYVDDSTIVWTSKFVEQSIGSEIWMMRFEEEGSEVKVQIEIKGMRPRILEGKLVK